MYSIQERLKKLEKQFLPDKMVVIADFNGEQRECYLDECNISVSVKTSYEQQPPCNTNGKGDFVRIVRGGTTEDIIKILNAIRQCAVDYSR